MSEQWQDRQLLMPRVWLTVSCLDISLVLHWSLSFPAFEFFSLKFFEITCQYLVSAALNKAYIYSDWTDIQLIFFSYVLFYTLQASALGSLLYVLEKRKKVKVTEERKSLPSIFVGFGFFYFELNEFFYAVFYILYWMYIHLRMQAQIPSQIFLKELCTVVSWAFCKSKCILAECVLQRNSQCSSEMKM